MRPDSPLQGARRVMPPDFDDPSSMDRPREREYLRRSALRQSASARGPGCTSPSAPAVLALGAARRGQRHCQCEARHAVAAIVYTVYIVYYITADTYGSCLLKIARWSRYAHNRRPGGLRCRLREGWARQFATASRCPPSITS